MKKLWQINGLFASQCFTLNTVFSFTSRAQKYTGHLHNHDWLYRIPLATRNVAKCYKANDGYENTLCGLISSNFFING